MKESFIRIDVLIQKIPDKELQQDFMLALIDLINELAGDKVKEYFNPVSKEPDD